MIGSLVGRERELAQAAEGLIQVAEGRGSVFLLTGEPGIGKTRLADAIARDAEGRGFRVAWARCWEGEGAPANWPWTQLLDELGEVLPARLAATTDASDARFALFSAVTARLIEIARGAPLLLVLDDLHVADVSSLLLLQFVARAIHAVPIGIVGTYRDADARIMDAAARTLIAIAREAVYLPLQRFSIAEIAAYAEQLDVQLSATRLHEVARVTEGNPLFVDHVVRTLPRFAVPPTLRAALRDRLAQVGDRAVSELLAMVAVAGREAGLATLARLANMPVAMAAERLAPAVAAGVLEPIVESARFTHVLLRDELYASLPAERRVAIHAALANALDQSDPLTAHHALAGLTVIGAERAVATVTLAAERSLAMLAFEDAAALLARALEALDASADPGHGIDLLTKRGVALMRAGEVATGKRSCARAAERARARGDGRRFAEAALTYGSEFTPSLVDPELVGLLEESLRLLPEDARSLRARALARLAAAMQPAHDPFVPMAMAREAIALARDLDDDERRAVLYSASSALADRGEPGESLALDTELAWLARRAGDRVQALRVEARLVFDCMEDGDVAAADTHLAAYAELVADFREPRYHWPVVLMRAMRALFDGRLEEVDRLHEECRGTEGDANFRIALATQRFFRLLAAERLDEATVMLKEMTTASSQAPRLALVVHALAALIATRRRDRSTAASEVEALRRCQIPLEDPVIAKLVSEAYAFVGEPAERARLHQALLPRSGGMVSLGLTTMVVVGSVERLLALLAPGSAPAPDREPARPRFTVKPEGDSFRVEFGGDSVSLRASDGLRLVARLIERPGQDHHVMTLAPSDQGDAGEALDARAIAVYRSRAESLREELSEAERFGDPTRAAGKRAELERLTAELARGVGLGGRARRVASGAERARINVQRHIRKAIRTIGEHFPSLGRHLERSVKTGTYCRYDPE